MPHTHPTLAKARSQLALAVRDGNAEAEAASRGDLAFAHIERHITASGQYLTAEHRADLVTLLSGGGK